MPGDGLPELGDALVGQGEQQGLSIVQHDLPLQLAPDGKGELLRAAFGEVNERLRFLCLRGRRGRFRRGRTVQGLHKIAHLFLGAQIALGQKLIVGRLHGDFADLQILGQGALGGELCAGGQIPCQNVPPDAAVEGLVQRDAVGFFQSVG